MTIKHLAIPAPPLPPDLPPPSMISVNYILSFVCPSGLGHIVASILCILDWTNVGLIPTVGASKRLPSDIYLILCMLWTIIVSYARLSCIKLKAKYIFIYLFITFYCFSLYFIYVIVIVCILYALQIGPS